MDIVSCCTSARQSVRGYSVKNMAHQIGKAFGVSAPNILRDVWGIMRSVAVETGNMAVQYEMEKFIYNLGNGGNKSRFLDILYRAYKSDQTAYNKIYADMVDGGISADDIAKGMEKRMKDDQGVEKTEDLEDRYIPPSKQSEYNTLMKGLESSSVWSEATQEQRDKAKNKVYELTMGKADESMTEKISAGAEYGIDEADYLLYELALAVADKPSEQGKLGSYTNAEKAQAVMSTGLSDSEKAYLWYIGMQYKSDEPFNALDAGIDMDTYIRFKEFDSEVEADKDENGKSINGTKKQKVINWLNENNVGQDAYNFFMYEVKKYKS